MPRVHAGKKLSFRASTVEAFWNQASKSAFEAQIITPDGTQKEFLFKCCTCKRWYQYAAIQLGHRVEWKTYFGQQGVTQSSPWNVAMEVFNDLNNLEPQCATCNTSHDWETYYFQDEDDIKFEKKYGDDSQSEFEDDDGNLVDEDFIASDVCSQCGDEYTELFNHLACKSCKIQYCLHHNNLNKFDNNLVCYSCNEPLRVPTQNDFMDTLENVKFPSDG